MLFITLFIFGWVNEPSLTLFQSFSRIRWIHYASHGPFGSMIRRSYSPFPVMDVSESPNLWNENPIFF